MLYHWGNVVSLSVCSCSFISLALEKHLTAKMVTKLEVSAGHILHTCRVSWLSCEQELYDDTTEGHVLKFYHMRFRKGQSQETDNRK